MYAKDIAIISHFETNRIVNVFCIRTIYSKAVKSCKIPSNDIGSRNIAINSFTRKNTICKISRDTL